MNHLQHSLKLSLALILPLLCAVLLVNACKKETHIAEFIAKPFSSEPVSSRDAFEITSIGWLDTFQTNLALAVNNNSLTQTYTLEKMAAGVEALINIATVSNKPRTVHQTDVTDFQVTVSSTSQALKDIYNGAYNAYRNYWLSTDTTETYPVAVDVAIVSMAGNVLNVRATSILGVCNACLIENYTSSEECDGTFESDEAFYVGGGDEELSLAGFYTLPMCDWECGETPACATPATTAYEQIEARINFNYLANNPPCPSGYTFVGYINVTGPVYAQGPYTFLDDDCEFLQQEVGVCMEDADLNCAYCSFYEQIGLSPFSIPSGKKFISLNLGLQVCACGGSTQCRHLTEPEAEYYYGTPVCKPTIPVPGWNDPVLVDLSTLSI